MRKPWMRAWPARLARAAALVIAIGIVMPAGAQNESGSNTLITLAADNASVSEVLRILAERSNLNIVVAPEVQGRTITIQIRNTPFEEALNLVVRAAGLGYERVGNSILVADITRLDAPTGEVTKVFDLQYANGHDLSEMLQMLTHDIATNTNGTQLVMRGTQSAIEQAENVVSVLDQKPALVLLEARLIEVNTTALLEAGIDWEKITKYTEVFTEGNQGESPYQTVPENIDYVKADEGQDFFRQMASFEVTLDALITDGTARLLSNSKVLTVAGEPAEIFSGETVPVVITSLQSPGQVGGVLQTVQLEKIDVGVKLQIVPRVSDQGYITALVSPEVSRIVAFVGPDDDLPETSTRRASALVRVRDGQKIFLGGLLSEEKRSTVKKVPLLGQIPLVGLLFQHHRVETVRLDLVIEITPRIVTDEGFVLPSALDREMPKELEK